MKRFLISIKIALIITFTSLASAEAKDNPFGSGADAFTPTTPTLSRPAQTQSQKGYFGSRKTINGNGSGAPKKGSSGSGSPHNPSMKKESHTTLTHPTRPYPKSRKKKKQCSLNNQYRKNEQIKDELIKKSIQAEKELEKQLGRRIKAIIAQKVDHRYFIPDAQTRDKFLHAPDFGVKIPESFDFEHAKSLPYYDRLKYLRDRRNLPEKSVRELQEAFRDHVLDFDTVELPGTFGANREAHKGIPKTYGNHLYNPETVNDLFFGPGNRLKSGWHANEAQAKEIETKHNLS